MMFSTRIHIVLLIAACFFDKQGPVKTYSLRMEKDIYQKSISYLALGDSYTIGEGVEQPGIFPWQTSLLLKQKGWKIDDPVVIAKTGWTTGELQTAIDKAEITREFDFVSLLIGVNNQYRGYPIGEYEQEFSKLLSKAIGFAGKEPDHVFVLSIPDWGKTPFAEGRDREKIAREIDAFNAVNKRITTQMGANYIDITPETRKVNEFPDLLTGDRLHPSAKAYAQWAEKLAAAVDEKFRDRK
jgi:lysophospholipase L1-like esterase